MFKAKTVPPALIQKQKNPMVRHFLRNDYHTKEELLCMLQTAKMIHEGYLEGDIFTMLHGRTLGMLFNQSSTRTRVSFEAGMTEMGGHSQYLSKKTTQFGSKQGESIKDTAIVLSSMVDGIMIREDDQRVIEEIAEYSSVPVINGMSLADYHPPQAFTDVYTILQHLPEGKSIEDVNLTFLGPIGDLGCVARSIANILGTLGANVTFCRPEGEEQQPQYLKAIEDVFANSPGTFKETKDVIEGVKNADYLVTDSWWYSGYDGDKKERVKRLLPYQIHLEMMDKLTPKHCKVMHCLPANRGYEILDGVFDNPDRSLIFHEAENRKHAQKGILAWLLFPLVKNPLPSLNEREETIRRFILENVIRFNKIKDD